MGNRKKKRKQRLQPAPPRTAPVTIPGIDYSDCDVEYTIWYYLAKAVVDTGPEWLWRFLTTRELIRVTPRIS